MICRKCQKEIPEGSAFCNHCGTEQNPKPGVKQRGNGQGTVYKRNGKWVAAVTLGYYREDGKIKRKTRSRSYQTKREAVQALGELRTAKAAPPKISFKAAFDQAIEAYQSKRNRILRSAVKWLKALYPIPLSDVAIMDIQDCVDACPRGKSTRQEIKNAAVLTYKHAITRGLIEDKINIALFVTVTGATRKKDGLPTSYLTALTEAIGKVKYADYIVCQCYLGYRPTELLSLRVRDYDPVDKTFVGGIKTDAGKGRIVTISPKIQDIVTGLVVGKGPDDYVFDADGRRMRDGEYRDLFYAALDACGLQNPIIDGDGLTPRHTYTPHSCRHTFATLVKRVDGADKDKLELIGHTDTKMLQHYQDVSLDDLRAITDKI